MFCYLFRLLSLLIDVVMIYVVCLCLLGCTGLIMSIGLFQMNFGVCSGDSCIVFVKQEIHKYMSSKALHTVQHPLKSPLVLDCAHPMPICNVSSQDAFYCSSVKVNKNLTQEHCLFKFP